MNVFEKSDFSKIFFLHNLILIIRSKLESHREREREREKSRSAGNHVNYSCIFFKLKIKFRLYF